MSDGWEQGQGPGLFTRVRGRRILRSSRYQAPRLGAQAGPPHATLCPGEGSCEVGQASCVARIRSKRLRVVTPEVPENFCRKLMFFTVRLERPPIRPDPPRYRYRGRRGIVGVSYVRARRQSTRSGWDNIASTLIEPGVVEAAPTDKGVDSTSGRTSPLAQKILSISQNVLRIGAQTRADEARLREARGEVGDPSEKGG